METWAVEGKKDVLISTPPTAIFDVSSSAKRALHPSQTKESNISATVPSISAKEPYISAKVPYISTKKTSSSTLIIPPNKLSSFSVK